MKKIGNKFIVGIDHGYGNIKTANCCFEAGLLKFDNDPPITRNMLIYEGKKYPLLKTDKNANCHTKRNNLPSVDYSRMGGGSHV